LGSFDWFAFLYYAAYNNPISTILRQKVMMATYSIPYGQTQQSFILPDEHEVNIVLPPQSVSLPREDVSQKIKEGLAQPLGSEKLDSFRNARSVAIAVNDKTRPVSYDLMLPPLLSQLEKIGISRSAVRLFIANGTHVPMPPEEYSRILPGNIISQYSIHSHDCDQEANLVFIGKTPRGTDIFANRLFYEADLKIVTGNIEPHHFAGFSGGSKTASIGVCGRKTINQNHAMLIDPNSMIGIYDENPLRQDIEDIGDSLGVDYALNFVVSGNHEVADVLFGNPRLVLQAGIPTARKICQTPVVGLYDVVIASAGGYPKDINLYQAQKAMTHASLLAHPGGTIILVAACPEGSGSASYEAYMRGATSHEEILKKFKMDGFRVGPHKGFQIARLATQFEIILVTQMPPEKVNTLLLTPASSLQDAVDQALAHQPPHSRIAVLPHATSTIPITV
jgi:nickel-dependent lactate racemase